ncbi:MAG: dephospho-CoA kinase [Gemmatimonadota bacterium]|nr:MAG: dephospho-CoA kinase [Gemmatimonadota bacterium]
MLNVALTGNVAAGKSSVARWFGRWGATIIDSDALVREVQQPGTDTLQAIARRFGSNVLRPDGSLNRAALRGQVLGDDNALTALNEIVHPAVQLRRSALVREAKARGDKILINDIPLLFEVLDPEEFDLVVLVDAPVQTRRKRLLGRGLSAAEAERLIATQLPSSDKRSRSDIIIDNDGSLDDLKRAARIAWDRIAEHAANAPQ